MRRVPVSTTARSAANGPSKLTNPRGSSLSIEGASMAARISPLMWPVLVLASPVLVPTILWRNRAFKANRTWAEKANRERIEPHGGTAAFRSKSVRIPPELSALKGKPCYLPDKAETEGFDGQVVRGPMILAAGIGTTGPLARSMFFLGLCEEQALVARVRDKGLVVITGCGHPAVEMILKLVRRLSAEPLYAIAGGFHFPVTASRLQRRGIQLQMFFGTGKPPWQRITDDDLTRTIAHINEAAPQRVLLSAHDTCDHALDRLAGELNAETMVLEAGQTYRVLS
jgi:hypothetical protein